MESKKTPPLVVVSVYGDRHVHYALVLLESLRQLGHVRERALVAVAEVDSRSETLLSRNAVVVPLSFNFGAERTARVARKLVGWETCAEKLVGESVVFLDADTIVAHPVDTAFTNPFDVAHTYHHGRRWRINSGVVFVRMTERALSWLRVWRDLTEWVLADDKRRQSAIDRHGAPDQAALSASLILCSGYDGLLTCTLPGEVWNEDWISMAPTDVAIWHLKGMLPALLGDRDLTDDDVDRQALRWRSLHAHVNGHDPNST